jgi:hypothetical protein
MWHHLHAKYAIRQHFASLDEFVEEQLTPGIVSPGSLQTPNHYGCNRKMA